MKVLVLGHGRHGKDTVAEMLRDMVGIKFESSSEAASEILFDDICSRIDTIYPTPADAFAHRHNHREIWKAAITSYNTPDKSKLCKAILKKSDMYVGMRCIEEYEASKDLFDLVIYVDASERHPDDVTMTIPFERGMRLLDNNGTLEDLKQEVGVIARVYFDSDLSIDNLFGEIL